MAHRTDRHRSFSLLDIVVMLIVVALATLILPERAHAQTTCPAAGPNPPTLPNDVRLNWTAPAQFTDGTAFPAGTLLSYAVYRQTGATWALQCTTASIATTLANQPGGTQTYAVTATVPGNLESARSNSATKDIPRTTNPPTGLTVITMTVTVTVATP